MPDMMDGHAMMTSSALLAAVNHCAATCEHMITRLLYQPDIHSRANQIQLLRDCASICATMSCFLSRNSVFSKMIAGACAYICEVCGSECARFPDMESQRCSHICLCCARDCRAFAGH